MSRTPLNQLHGALLVDKHAGISSFGMIEQLQRILGEAYGVRRRDLPKMGHGGTLDPFATGLLIVCVGRAVKLARYFLGSGKEYTGRMRFGETTVPGDPTAPVSERSEQIPSSREELAEIARRLCAQPYLQTPPMHSAKKKNGKPLYELAREGIEVEREAKLCHLHSFDIPAYSPPVAEFRVRCSAGTYVRTLAQDFARLQNSVAMLETLRRTGSGSFDISRALSIDSLERATREGRSWNQLGGAWVPFDRILDGYDRAEATHEEAEALMQGQQGVLFNIVKRASGTPSEKSAQEDPCLAIYERERLVAIARCEQGVWGLERVFTSERSPFDAGEPALT
jgi:tRNA pseudouridine55 synthase